MEYEMSQVTERKQIFSSKEPHELVCERIVFPVLTRTEMEDPEWIQKFRTSWRQVIDEKRNAEIAQKMDNNQQIEEPDFSLGPSRYYMLALNPSTGEIYLDIGAEGKTHDDIKATLPEYAPDHAGVVTHSGHIAQIRVKDYQKPALILDSLDHRHDIHTGPPLNRYIVATLKHNLGIVPLTASGSFL